MIRQFCPHCFRPVELPDDAAGTTFPCPQCGKGFPVPGRYTPAVDPGLVTPSGGSAPVPEKPTVPDPTPDPRPQPPPGFIPPPPAGPAADPGTGSAGTPPARGGVTLSPAALDWFPAACFTLILVLTCFAWVGLYPGGDAAYTQSPWGMMAGDFWRNPFSESVLKIEQELHKQVRSDWVMLPYLLGLLAAVGIAWADRLVRADVAARPGVHLPPRLGFLTAVWPHRFPILAGLAIGLLALLLIQAYAGFSLETALHKVVDGRARAEGVGQATAPAPPAAAERSSAMEREAAIRQGMQLAQYRLQTTTWFGLAVGTHVVAVVAAGLRLWLYRRGSKPRPRVWWAW